MAISKNDRIWFIKLAVFVIWAIRFGWHPDAVTRESERLVEDYPE